MKLRTIEVDEEVFSFLQNAAEAFVDTPNTVLRRLLLDDKKFTNLAGPKPEREVLSSLPEFPVGTPATICEILSVVRLVDAGHSRTEATQIAAARYGLTQQTVLDKYTRQLGLTAAEFDQVVAEDERQRLFELLAKRMPGYDALIRKHLGNAS